MHGIKRPAERESRGLSVVAGGKRLLLTGLLKVI